MHTWRLDTQEEEAADLLLAAADEICPDPEPNFGSRGVRREAPT